METDAPNPAEIARELEELKAWLVGLTPDELESRQSERLAREISSIRLQLKRLEADRVWALEALERMNRSRPSDPD